MTTQQLDVYVHGELAATIRRVRGSLRLQYLPDYILHPDSVPLSVQFPVTPATYSGEKVQWFLDNLLPDRSDVRDAWAREAGLDTSDTFDLLAVYGADVAGALEFYPSGNAPQRDAQLTPVDAKEIAAQIREIRADDSLWRDAWNTHTPFSLAGAQGKFALTKHEGEWYQPSEAAPSTHIIKPGVQGLPGSDVTEHITMELARRLSMKVARTSIEQFAGEHALAVERFDRVEVGGEHIRIHQEDLAQATGTPVLKKYEKDGGPGIRRILDAFTQHLNPLDALDAKRRFAECIVFSWIIGHNDGHAKNYSLQHFPGVSIFAPLHDLNCNLAFELEETCRGKRYQAFDTVELSFAVNGNRTIGGFNADSLRALERDAGLEAGYLSTFARRVAESAGTVINSIIDELPSELQELPAVKNYPYVVYSQALRVKDALF